MFCPLPKDSVAQSHANDVSTLAQEAYYRSQRLSGGIITTLDARSCNKKRKKEEEEDQKKDTRKKLNPDRRRRVGKRNRAQVIPCNAGAAPSAPSAAQVGNEGAHEARERESCLTS